MKTIDEILFDGFVADAASAREWRKSAKQARAQGAIDHALRCERHARQVEGYLVRSADRFMAEAQGRGATMSAKRDWRTRASKLLEELRLRFLVAMDRSHERGGERYAIEAADRLHLLGGLGSRW